MVVYNEACQGEFSKIDETFAECWPPEVISNTKAKKDNGTLSQVEGFWYALTNSV